MKLPYFVVFSFLLSNQAFAGFTEIPYAQKVVDWNTKVDEIIRLSGVEPQFVDSIKREAMEYTYIGPCEGRVDAFPDHGASAIDATSDFQDPRNRMAVFAISGYLAATNLGRKPEEDACKFAFEMATSGINIPSK